MDTVGPLFCEQKGLHPLEHPSVFQTVYNRVVSAPSYLCGAPKRFIIMVGALAMIFGVFFLMSLALWFIVSGVICTVLFEYAQVRPVTMSKAVTGISVSGGICVLSVALVILSVNINRRMKGTRNFRIINLFMFGRWLSFLAVSLSAVFVGFFVGMVILAANPSLTWIVFSVTGWAVNLLLITVIFTYIKRRTPLDYLSHMMYAIILTLALPLLFYYLYIGRIDGLEGADRTLFSDAPWALWIALPFLTLAPIYTPVRETLALSGLKTVLDLSFFNHKGSTTSVQETNEGMQMLIHIGYLVKDCLKSLLTVTNKGGKFQMFRPDMIEPDYTMPTVWAEVESRGTQIGQPLSALPDSSYFTIKEINVEWIKRLPMNLVTSLSAAAVAHTMGRLDSKNAPLRGLLQAIGLNLG
ncbi:hypothetical protein KIPB_005347, partial [Kipferlia bialata]|eukprot:g5347.t1